MKKLSKFSLLIGVAAAALSAPASAQTLGETWSKDRFQLRVRAIGVLADGDGTVAQNGLKTDVDSAATPEVDLSYFFTPNIAAELIAATSEHDVDAGTLNLGSAWILPPTLTIQYHFSPDQQFSPYIGAGLNYSMFYGEDDGAGFNNLDVDGGVGYAIQAGFDYWMSDNWGLNLDVKYINLEIDVDVDLAGTHLDADNVDLNPWIVGGGVSYRF